MCTHSPPHPSNVLCLAHLATVAILVSVLNRLSSVYMHAWFLCAHNSFEHHLNTCTVVIAVCYAILYYLHLVVSVSTLRVE